jgi:hypothetical protein
MKTEHTYRWMTKWNGKMTPTRHHCTEEAIRKSHPEAVRIEGSLIVREIPETPEEWRARMLAVDTANIGLNAKKD